MQVFGEGLIGRNPIIFFGGQPKWHPNLPRVTLLAEGEKFST